MINFEHFVVVSIMSY